MELYRYHDNQDALATLLFRYSDMISIRAARYLSTPEEREDFAMDLYLHLQQKLKTCDVQYFRAWLMKTVTNRLLDIMRKQKVRELHREAVQQSLPPTHHMDNRVNSDIDLSILHEALGQLNDKERTAIDLLYLQQLSYDEALAQTGWTINQLRGSRDRAIRKLRRWLGPSLEHYFTNP